MTFLEAAIAILKREGQPLHFKKLTEIALKDNLLTVVGRTPEATMQQRLNDALKKGSTQPLTREKPGVYGLRYYPPPEGSVVDSAPVDAAPEALVPALNALATTPAMVPIANDGAAPVASSPEGEERKRRRRRGGRGRKKRTDGTALDKTKESGSVEDDREEAAAEELAAVAPTDSSRAVVAPSPTPPRIEPESVMPESEPARSVSPSVEPARRSFAEAAAMVAAAHGRQPAQPPGPPIEIETPVNPPVSIAEGSTLVESQATFAMPSEWVEETAASASTSGAIDESLPSPVEGFEDEDLAGDMEAPSGPLIAPAIGTEDMVRGEDHRPLFEGNQRRPGRERGGRRGKGAPHIRGTAHAASPSHAAPAADRSTASPPPRDARPVEGRPIETRVAGATSMSLVDVAAEILRGSDGRPVPIKQLIELAMRRNLLHGDPAELSRSMRAEVLVDLRARDAIGLRPRVRPVGGGQYVLGDRKLEAELSLYERELGERAARLSEATRVALHRRIARLSPPAFEALARLIVGRLGVGGVELVKRGDGVVYLGGVRVPGVQKVTVLIAVRPGEGELKRRAVGELRAGLKARTFDEGICIAAGRAGAEAIAELGAGAGRVELYDGDALATLCARFAIGITKRSVTVDTLDVELFNELQEG